MMRMMMMLTMMMMTMMMVMMMLMKMMMVMVMMTMMMTMTMMMMMMMMMKRRQDGEGVDLGKLNNLFESSGLPKGAKERSKFRRWIWEQPDRVGEEWESTAKRERSIIIPEIRSARSSTAKLATRRSSRSIP